MTFGSGTSHRSLRVGRIEHAPDYGSQPPLFPDDPRCPSCGTRNPDACGYQEELRRDEREWRPRPKGCLRSGQLLPHEELPF